MLPLKVIGTKGLKWPYLGQIGWFGRHWGPKTDPLGGVPAMFRHPKHKAPPQGMVKTSQAGTPRQESHRGLPTVERKFNSFFFKAGQMVELSMDELACQPTSRSTHRPPSPGHIGPPLHHLGGGGGGFGRQLSLGGQWPNVPELRAIFLPNPPRGGDRIGCIRRVSWL